MSAWHWFALLLAAICAFLSGWAAYRPHRSRKPSDALPDVLGRLHQEGCAIREQLTVPEGLPPAVSVALRLGSSPAQIWCEAAARAWDEEVRRAMEEHSTPDWDGGRAWNATPRLSSATYPGQSVTDLAGLRRFYDAKLASLAQLIRWLDDAQ